MHAIPYLISFICGYLLIKELIPTSSRASLPLLMMLAIGLGLGTSSLLTFYSFLLAGQHQPVIILLCHVILLGFLIWLGKRHQKPFIDQRLKQKPQAFSLLCLTIWCVFLAVIYYLASKHPFGEWDAWALWNMKTKFLLYHGKEWKAIFDQLHWHTQPDYPLLLPNLHIWTLTFSKTFLPHLPMITTILFTIASGILLYAGLKSFIDKKVALLASSLLLVQPFFLHLATAQYADTLLSFYLLASFITLTLALRENKTCLYFLTGLLLGLLTFTKNEGIVFALLLGSLTTLYLWQQHRSLDTSPLPFLQALFSGLAVTGVASLIFKLFLAPVNRDIFFVTSTDSLRFFNWDGWLIVWQFIVKETFSITWLFFWVFILFMVITRIPKFFL